MTIDEREITICAYNVATLIYKISPLLTLESHLHMQNAIFFTQEIYRGMRLND